MKQASGAFIKLDKYLWRWKGFAYRNGRGRAARYKTWKKLKDEA